MPWPRAGLGRLVRNAAPGLHGGFRLPSFSLHVPSQSRPRLGLAKGEPGKPSRPAVPPAESPPPGGARFEPPLTERPNRDPPPIASTMPTITIKRRRRMVLTLPSARRQRDRHGFAAGERSRQGVWGPGPPRGAGTRRPRRGLDSSRVRPEGHVTSTRSTIRAGPRPK